METLMGQTQPQPKAGLLRTLVLLLLGVLAGAMFCFFAIAKPAQRQAAKAELQRQVTVSTLVKLGQEHACRAKTFDEAVGVESLARDTLRDANVQFPEDARQKIELCAEKLRYPKVEGPPLKPAHRKTGKKR